MSSKNLLSIVVPAYNEVDNIEPLYNELLNALPHGYDYEFIFVNDGSKDQTEDKIRQLNTKDKRVQLVNFSRNFGKELATTAGIHQAHGDAIIMLDADGQHPMELIATFLELWEKGNQVIVGVRVTNKNEGLIKKYGSLLFYKIFNKVTGINLTPGSTDFRLIDKEVRSVFIELSETNRITRGLIDWLGFQRIEVPFHAKPRLHGEAAYNTKKLFKLAVNSFLSLSFTPLYLFGYVGFMIATLSFVLGCFVIIEQFMMSDPMGLKVTGSAALGILVVFLVGIVLISQWITSLYISRMYEETKRRPLYIINERRSILK